MNSKFLPYKFRSSCVSRLFAAWWECRTASWRASRDSGSWYIGKLAPRSLSRKLTRAFSSLFTLANSVLVLLNSSYILEYITKHILLKTHFTKTQGGQGYAQQADRDCAHQLQRTLRRGEFPSFCSAFNNKMEQLITVDVLQLVRLHYWSFLYCSWRRCGAAVSSARRAAPDSPKSSARRHASSAPKPLLNAFALWNYSFFLIARHALSESIRTLVFIQLSLMNVLLQCCDR